MAFHIPLQTPYKKLGRNYNFATRYLRLFDTVTQLSNYRTGIDKVLIMICRRGIFVFVRAPISLPSACHP